MCILKNSLRVSALICLLFMFGCSDFLDKKPDLKMVIPKSFSDAELLINDYNTLNTGYPIVGEMGTDDYFLRKETFDAISNIDQRNTYLWKDQTYTDVNQWQRPYKAVYVANQVIDILNKLGVVINQDSYNSILGSAYFYRAFAFHQLIEVYCPAFEEKKATNQLGIPLRLTPEIDEGSVRVSLLESYKQVILDYERAILSLPIVESVKGRPQRSSAYAGLARVYLDIGEYEKAYKYADSSLLFHSSLLDFNQLNPQVNNPIARFNVEVIFPAISAPLGSMGRFTALVDTLLYVEYDEYDIRKQLYFEASDNKKETFFIKVNYNNSTGQMFVGLTTSEMYLIKAESAVRIGMIEESQNSLNYLLKNRWRADRFIAIKESNPQILLDLILKERRKELIFRGRRWADLKRLNLDERYKRAIYRKMNEVDYVLPPNSLKYAYRLPESVLRLGKIPQNER